jgi:hypothetical protein
MSGLGACLFLCGLTRSAPEACVLGTLGIALIAEGATNAGCSDVRRAAESVTHWARGGLGTGASTPSEPEQAAAAVAGGCAAEECDFLLAWRVPRR